MSYLRAEVPRRTPDPLEAYEAVPRLSRKARGRLVADLFCLNKSGQLSFGEHIAERIFGSKASVPSKSGYVVLLVSAKEGRIAIRALGADEDDSLARVATRQRYTFRVSLGQALRQMGMGKPKTATYYDAEEIAPGVWGFDFTEEAILD